VQVTTSDPDLARARCAEIYFPHRLTMLHDPGEFSMSLSAVDLGPVAAGVLSYAGEVVIETGELTTGCEVNLALDGVLRTRSGRVDVCSTATTAAVYRPDGTARLHGWVRGGRLFGLKIDRGALEDQLAALLDRPVRGAVALAPTVDLESEGGRRWWSLVRALVDLAADPRGLAADPRVMGPLVEAVVAGLLHTVDHPYRDALATPAVAVGPRSVRRAVAAVVERPEHPWTVASLAAIAGVSARGLRDGMVRHHGVSPMALGRDVRLRRARDDLAAGRGGVAEVAMRWGFTHLGRFARSYREAFGEPPSRTAGTGARATARGSTGEPRHT